jgi:hypothetical protein
MAGLVPSIHVLAGQFKNVGARDKPGHDEKIEWTAQERRWPSPTNWCCSGSIT